MLYLELIGKMSAQGLYAVTLGRVMSGAEIVDAQFTSFVRGLFGHLAADKQVGTESMCFTNVTLGRAGTPG